MKRHFLPLLLLAFLAPALRAAERPPNIIHIIADDVGYDDIGAFGCKDIPTPNLDRMAQQGMRFTNFYAPGAVCTPSRAAILTGCYAPRVSLPDVLFPFSKVGLSDKEVTIAELLKTRGYATAVIGKWHLGHQKQFLPTNHGFDVFYGIPYPNDHEPVRVIWDKQARANGWTGVEAWRPPPIPLHRGTAIEEQPADLERCPQRFVAEAVKWMREHRERPFYLHLANIETHTPYFVASRFQNFTPAGAYADAVVSMDWMVGEIEAALQQLGLAENTLIVFSSDNGPLLENHNDLPRVYGRYGVTNTDRKHVLRGAKGSLWEGGVRVACVMKWTGKIAAGTECAEIAAGFDLYSTFAKVAGAELPADRLIDGRDLRPLMFGDPGAKSPHEAFFYFQGYRLGAVRQGRWKLAFPGRVGGGGGALPRPALYDLESDIAESQDVAAQQPEVVAQLAALADNMRADLGDSSRNAPGSGRRPAGRAEAMAE